MGFQTFVCRYIGVSQVAHTAEGDPRWNVQLFLRGPLGRFEHQVAALPRNLAGGGPSPVQFRQALSTLSEALNQLGWESLGALMAQLEGSADALERDGTVYRGKGVSPKEWFTPWGRLEVGRRLYQADRGRRCWVPLDQRCGMVDRFLGPSRERLCCLLGAQLVPAAAVAAALFGAGSAATQRYFDAWRHRLRHQPGAAQDLLRPMERLP